VQQCGQVGDAGLLEPRPRIRVGRRGLELLGHLGGGPVHDGDQQGFLGRVVVVDRGRLDPGRGGDVADRGGVETTAGEQLNRGGQDVAAAIVLAARPPDRAARFLFHAGGQPSASCALRQSSGNILPNDR
jgi:hypothetical protein